MGTLIETVTRKQYTTTKDIDGWDGESVVFTTDKGERVRVLGRHIVSLTALNLGPTDEEHRQQGGTPPDFAIIYATGVYRGVHPDKVDALMAALAARPGIRMGPWTASATESPNSAEVQVGLSYGPVLGAWPADIRRQMHLARERSGTTAQLLLLDDDRRILAKREQYDALVAELGKDEARARLGCLA